MELKECDCELHLNEHMLCEYQSHYDVLDQLFSKILFERELLRNQINIAHNKINELKQVKMNLCGTNQTGSKSNKEPSSLFQSVGAVVEDYVQAIQNSTNAEVAKTLND